MPTVRIPEFDGPRTRQGVWLSDRGGTCEARRLVFPRFFSPIPWASVFIARAAGSFPRFPPSIPGLPSYSCRMALVFAGKPGIDEGRWYEAAGGMSGVVSVACGFARVMSAQRISSSRASRHPFLVRQGGFPGFRRVFDDMYPRVSGRFVGLSPPVPGLPYCSCRMTPVSVGKPGIGPCDRRETWNRPLRSSGNLD